MSTKCKINHKHKHGEGTRRQGQGTRARRARTSKDKARSSKSKIRAHKKLCVDLLICVVGQTERQRQAQAGVRYARAVGRHVHTKRHHVQAPGSDTGHVTIAVAVACRACRDFAESGQSDFALFINGSAMLYTCWAPLSPRVVQSSMMAGSWPTVTLRLAHSMPTHIVPSPTITTHDNGPKRSSRAHRTANPQDM